MSDVILVLNAGSSSIKFRVFRAREHPQDNPLTLLLRGQIDGLYTSPQFTASDEMGAHLDAHQWPQGTRLGHHGAIEYITDFLRRQQQDNRLIAVGHRVVHGGMDYTKPVLISAPVISKLETLIPLAPLHQPHNLEPIRILASLRPELPQVACFDTAFHRAQPEVAQAFALPASLTERGVRRYGFHGLSYEYIAGVLRDFDDKAASGRTVVAHLGNGSSMCAIKAGRSMASTMGFTAVDGLPMGTRSGNLDPGVILFLMDEMKMDARAIENLIYKQSGLLGVSGLSSDMRELLDSDAPRARFALELFTYRAGREVASLAAAMAGLDAVVFTAGIGEHAAVIRERICSDAAWLGLELDRDANLAGGPRISKAGSRVSAWVIPTNEELMIARHTYSLLGSARP